MKKIIGFSLAMVCMASVADMTAAPVSPEKAREEAAQFHVRNSASFTRGHHVNSASDLELVYTSTSKDGNCFYVFNSPGDSGFTIISADDRLPSVLGFTESGSFDEEKLPCNMKWWLGEYTKEITEFIIRNPTPVSKPVRIRPLRKRTDRGIIAPLLKTTWDQTEPYNNDCPIDSRTGQRSVTGCVATAMAQVMKFHEWPVNPKGVVGGLILNGTTLEWSNMLDSYTNYNWTKDQAAAVAQLMRQCGASVKMVYSSYASGAYSFDVPNALTENFDYNASMELQYRDYFTQNAWNDMVYEELASNRPVYYSGQSNAGGHAFVCDGYLGDDLFHFNWGWSGYQDGYFRLNALNPSTGGTGSYSGGYNQEQSIILGVKKSQGETKRQQLLISTGNFIYESGNTYTITGGGNYNLIYNPLAYQQSFNVGLKVVPFSGDGQAYYFKSNQKQTLSSLYGFTQMEVLIGNIPDGKYKVSPAMFTSYEEWQDILIPYGMQSYVVLTVSGGKKVFTNEGPGEETISHLLLSDPEYVSPLYTGNAVAFNLTADNVGKGDFYGNVSLGLYPESGFGEIVEMYAQASVPGESSADIKFIGSKSPDEGKYEMYLLDSDLNYLMEPIPLDIKKNPHSVMPPTGALIVTEISPNFFHDGDETGVTLTVTNTSESDVTSHIRMRLLRAEDWKEVESMQTQALYSFPADEAVTAHFAPRVFNLPAGDYFWLCEDDKGKVLSLPYPMKVTGKQMETEVGYYRATSVARNEAVLTAVKSETGATKFSIDEFVEGYRVTSMRSDIFTFNPDVEAVTIPSGVEVIPTGEFYNAASLKYLKMNRKKVPELKPDVFGPEVEKNVIISGANGGYTNIFHESPVWDKFRMSSWTLEIGEGVNILTGLLTGPDGKYYNPYYLGADEQLVLTVSCKDDECVVADFEFDGIEGQNISSTEIRLPGLYGASGKVRLTKASKSAVEITGADLEPLPVYTPDGILVDKAMKTEDLRKLPKGIYIRGGKKHIIR